MLSELLSQKMKIFRAIRFFMAIHVSMGYVFFLWMIDAVYARIKQSHDYFTDTNDAAIPANQIGIAA